MIFYISGFFQTKLWIQITELFFTDLRTTSISKGTEISQTNFFVQIWYIKQQNLPSKYTVTNLSLLKRICCDVLTAGNPACLLLGEHSVRIVTFLNVILTEGETHVNYRWTCSIRLCLIVVPKSGPSRRTLNILFTSNDSTGSP